MAIIILKPNEKFEHTHLKPSTTTLVQGEVVCSYNEKKIKLTLNEAIDIPANSPHMMQNIGKTEAILDCEHE